MWCSLAQIVKRGKKNLVPLNRHRFLLQTGSICTVTRGFLPTAREETCCEYSSEHNATTSWGPHKHTAIQHHLNWVLTPTSFWWCRDLQTNHYRGAWQIHIDCVLALLSKINTPTASIHTQTWRRDQSVAPAYIDVKYWAQISPLERLPSFLTHTLQGPNPSDSTKAEQYVEN